MPINPNSWSAGLQDISNVSFPTAHIDSAEPEMNISKTKLSSIFKYKPLPKQSTKFHGETDLKNLVNILKKEDINVKESKIKTLPVIQNNEDTLIGIEVEIENSLVNYHDAKLKASELQTTINELFIKAWSNHQDGSLRNSGIEWISYPLPAKEIPYALRILRIYLECFYSKAAFNYRCGTHVHVDVRNFTVEQFINFVLLYVLFEDTFYKASGERYKNIYCVPIRASDCEIHKIFNFIHLNKPKPSTFKAIFNHFKKYMAFNLLPAGKNSGSDSAFISFEEQKLPFGTIEFRHHKGESDPEVLVPWIQLILDIHKAAQVLSFEEIKTLIFDMNERSNYLEFVKKIFRGSIPLCTDYSNIMRDMWEGSAYIKEMYLTSKGEV